LAVSYNTYKADGKTVIYEGLVPCGKEVCIYSGTETVGEFLEFLELFKVDHPDFTLEKNCEGLGGEWKSIPCQFCHFFVMFRGILDFVLKLVIIIGVLMLTIGGFMFFFAGGSPATLDRAKRVLTSTVIGLVIIFAAWLIINTIFMGIGVAKWTNLREGWFTIPCSIKPLVEKGEEGVAPEEKEEEQIKNEIRKILSKDVADITSEEVGLLEENPELVSEVSAGIEVPEETIGFMNSKGITLEGSTGITLEKEKEKEERGRLLCGKCGAGLLNPCDEKECLALGDSLNPCKFIATRRTIFTGTEYGYCEPK